MSHPPRRTLRRDDRAVQDVIGFILVFGILSVILVLSMLAFNVASGAAKSRAVELRAQSAASRVAGVVVQSALLAEQQGSSNLAVAYRVELPDQLEGAAYTIVLESSSTRTVTDGVTVANIAGLSSATATFTTADLGRTVTGGGLRTGTTIAAIVSPTRVTLSTAVLSSGSGQSITIAGPDQVAIVVPQLNLPVTAPVFSSGQSSTVKICGSTSIGGDVRVRYDTPPAYVPDRPLTSSCTLPAGVTKALFLEVS